MKTIKNIFAITFICIVVASCSTKAFVAKPGSLAGKKVAVSDINISRMKKGKTIQNDSVCTCLAQSIEETMYPYLLKAGATVVMLNRDQQANTDKLVRAADSLQIDYFLSGSGIAQRTGKDDLIWQLNLQLSSAANNEVIATGSFSGWGLTAAGAAKKVGEKMSKKLK